MFRCFFFCAIFVFFIRPKLLSDYLATIYMMSWSIHFFHTYIVDICVFQFFVIMLHRSSALRYITSLVILCDVQY